MIGIGGVLLLPVVWRVAKRRFDPFEPIFLFALAWGAMFVARPAAMLAGGHLSYLGMDIRGTLSRALLIGLIGAVAFVVGHEVRTGRGIASRLPTPHQVSVRLGIASAVVLTVLSFVAAVALVGSVSKLHLLLDGRSAELGHILGTSSTYLWYGSALVVPAAFLLIGLLLRERTALLLIAAACASALALLRTVPSGTRIILLPLVGGLFVLLYVRRGRRPSALTLLAVAVIALLGSYALLVFRYPDTRRGFGSAMIALARHPGRPFSPILSKPDAEMVPVLSAALTVIPSKLHYRYGGAVLGDLFTRPIPRQLWKGKPDPPDTKVTKAVWPHLGYYDPSYTPALFLYWDFGIFGVFVGMVLFGLLSRTLFEWLLRFRNCLSAQLIFAAALWFVVIGARDDPIDVLVIVSLVVGPLIVVDWVAGRRAFRPAPAVATRTLDVPEL